VITAKIMMLGDIGVGKSSVARRMVFGRFEADYKTTIGVDIMTYEFALSPECDNCPVKLIIWDTDGEFGQRIFDTAYIGGASGAIVVSDATRPTTVTKMNGLVTSFSERFPGRPVRAIVNKIDLAPGIDDATAPGFSDGSVLATSAKTGVGVAELFQSLGIDLWRRAQR